MSVSEMRAAVYRGARRVDVEEVPQPVPGQGELLLEIHAAGICGTDALEYESGPHLIPLHQPHPATGHVGPLIPGHEFSGRVAAVGPGVHGFTEGDLVASGAGVSCGTCRQCRRGRTNICESYATVGFHLNGALAEFCAVPASSCLAAEPYGLTGDVAALAQPMSIAVHAERRARLVGDDTVVIIGVGGVGAFLTFACAQHGRQVVVADLDERRLAVADGLGAHHTIKAEPDGPDLATAVATLGLVPDVVFEVTGTATGLAAARDMLPSGGRLVAVGHQHRPAEVDFRSLALAEQEMIGTQAHVAGDDLPEALRLLSAGEAAWRDIAPIALPLDKLVEDGLVPVAEGRSRQVKTLIDPRASSTRDTVMRDSTKPD